jgi:hypothetical protein
MSYDHVADHALAPPLPMALTRHWYCSHGLNDGVVQEVDDTVADATTTCIGTIPGPGDSVVTTTSNCTGVHPE